MSAALAWAARGFLIVPVHNLVGDACSCHEGASCGKSTAKHPRGAGWQTSATTDAATIRGWFGRWPAMNYGIMPPPGTWVLDVDPQNGADETLAQLEAQHGPLPRTLATRSPSGGRHLWFRGPDPGQLQNRDHVPGLDTRVNGKGQVVGPGSVALAGGYSLLDDTTIADGPAWLVAAMRKPERETPTQNGFESPTARPRAASPPSERQGYPYRFRCELDGFCARIPGEPLADGARRKAAQRAAETLGGRLGAHSELAGLRAEAEAALLDACAGVPPHWKIEAAITAAIEDGIGRPLPYTERDRNGDGTRVAAGESDWRSELSSSREEDSPTDEPEEFADTSASREVDAPSENDASIDSRPSPPPDPWGGRWRTLAEWADAGGWDWDRPPPPERWLLREAGTVAGGTRQPGQGVMPLGDVGFLAGAGGVGKSYALLQLALSVAAPAEAHRQCPDRFAWFGGLADPDRGAAIGGGWWVEPEHAGRVAMVMCEEKIEQAQQRIWRILRGMGLVVPNGAAAPEARRWREEMFSRFVLVPARGMRMGWLDKRGEVTDAFRRTRDSLAAAEHRLVILDPLSRFGGADVEKDPGIASELVGLAESLSEGPGEPNVLIAAHTSQEARRNNIDDATGIRGTTAIGDGGRWAADLRGLERRDGAPPLCQVKPSKHNHAPGSAALTLVRRMDAPGGVLAVASQAQREAWEAEGTKTAATSSDRQRPADSGRKPAVVAGGAAYNPGEWSRT